MSELKCQEFQEAVSNLLLRHQSILDLLSKSQETNARINRAVVKSITNCGCLQVHAEKKPFPDTFGLDALKYLCSSHLEGELCESCKDVIVDEIGRNLFYLTALCVTLGIDFQEVMEKEKRKISTLGRFNMT